MFFGLFLLIKLDKQNLVLQKNEFEWILISKTEENCVGVHYLYLLYGNRHVF